MYIKQVIIQGFKSYKEQTVIEPFSPRHNVIVGRNGSGKSNFFAAIRFVLGDAYTQMGREERNALLHSSCDKGRIKLVSSSRTTSVTTNPQEGTGSAVMSAFVEIIFDNSDDRFPTGKPELTLRRTIGMKKDEYSLDRKSATKTDVMNLLESAGFSRSNPYYIVPQGRVTALTNMKDGERLTLLKDVAGTQVYESRRVESLKIIEETRNRRKKIDELLEYIHQRLSELEEEKEELRDFQEKDRDRRSLQYTIDHREQLAIADELDTLDEQRQNGINDTDDNAERFMEGESRLETLQTKMANTRQQMELLQVDRDQLEQERREASKAQAQVDLEVTNLVAGEESANRAKAEVAAEIASLEAAIENHQMQLDRILDDYKGKQDAESIAKSTLDRLSAQRARLYEKQGRNARFRTKQERDRWLTEQMTANEPQIQKLQTLAQQVASDIAHLERQIQEDDNESESLRQQLNGRNMEASERLQAIEEAKMQRDRLMDERKELWREDAKLDAIIARNRGELRNAEKELSHTMDQDTSRGLAALTHLKRDLPGIHGTLAELMKVDEYYRRAVEVTAGQSLFHCIVDNDQTASKAIEILIRDKLGRLTFVPLNRIRPKTVNMPRANDAIPMLDKIEFSSQYLPAFQQVFGQSIICPSLTVAGQYARSHGVNGITLDGDRSDRKGAFTGGSLDSRRSRLTATQHVTKWRIESEATQLRSSEVKRLLERKDQEVTLAVGQLQKLEAQRVQHGPLKQELKGKLDALEQTRDELDKKTKARSNIEANLKAVEDQQEAHRHEKTSSFKKNLTSDEEENLEQLGRQIKDLQAEFSELSAQRSGLEGQKSVLEINLRENLQARLDQLREAELEELDGKSVRQAQAELSRRQKVLMLVSEKLKNFHAQIDTAGETLKGLKSEHDQILSKQNEIAKDMEKMQKRMEKSIQKRRILSEQAQSVNARIRDLGILPHGALERYERTKSEEVVQLLHQVTEALKKYSHVNKKAFEQYNNFTVQRDTLTGRRQELDNSHDSISELIAVLDQRKDEAIERTFKQVSKEFATVFEKLVPAGRGRLVIQRKMDRRQEEDSEDEEAHTSSVENYTGVGISVSFNSKHDEQQRIQQLSGGQKSLCALALVFAIQQCDPAPFYLFDEIDANLDAQYRTAVANMLQEISERSTSTQADSTSRGNEVFGSGQFICTTFRPEMLLVAEKCYGVRYLSNKSSSVVVVDKEEALKFVEGEKR